MEYKNNVSLSQLPITVIESHATELSDAMHQHEIQQHNISLRTDDAGNRFSDHKDECVGVFKDLGVEPPADMIDDPILTGENLTVWLPENYVSPPSSPSNSLKSKNPNTEIDWDSWAPFGDYYDTFMQNGPDKEISQYSDYFDFDNMSSKCTPQPDTQNIIRELGDIKTNRTRVLGNIPQDCKKLHVMYLCRIYVSQENIYKYIVGFTKDIENVLETIDDAYACEWNIEMLLVNACASQDDEVVIKYQLYEMGISIENNLYDINSKIYNHMVGGAEYTNPFYTINTSNDEEYLGKKVTNKDPTKF